MVKRAECLHSEVMHGMIDMLTHTHPHTHSITHTHTHTHTYALSQGQVSRPEGV